MRITTKMSLAVAAVFVVSMIANYWVIQTTIKPRFDDIEIKTAHMNHKRILEGVASLQGKLRASVQDWAYWDDAHDFLSGKNAESFITANLSAVSAALDSLGIEILVFLGDDNAVRWSEALDLETKQPLPTLVDELLAQGYMHPRLREPSSQSSETAVSGIVRTSHGLLLVATAPVLHSDRAGPAAGAIWMGVRLDQDALFELTGVEFTLAELSESQLTTPALMQSEPSLHVQDGVLATKSALIGLKGEPVALLTAVTERDISSAGADAIRSAQLHSLIVAALVMAILWLVMRITVIGRMEALQKHFGETIADGRLRTFPHAASSDEISQLADSFNTMVAQVNRLRDELAESAYLAGMSEWAAGTLHNVRNGMSPVNIAAWQIVTESEKSWLRSVKAALARMDEPNIETEIREKCAALIISKAPHALDFAQRVRASARQIMSASKAVEEMVSGYEKYSRHRLESEPIEVRSLIDGLARTQLGESGAALTWEVCGGPVVVSASAAVLRQIVANILNNAVEAVSNTCGEKILKIEIKAPELNAGAVAIAFIDNGEGISARNLKRIFERGFSTRGHRAGGLGLHWCANAARTLGGQLSARSGGVRKGATFILELPCCAPSPGSDGSHLISADVRREVA